MCEVCVAACRRLWRTCVRAGQGVYTRRLQSAAGLRRSHRRAPMSWGRWKRHGEASTALQRRPWRRCKPPLRRC